jgi:hypothetical protein
VRSDQADFLFFSVNSASTSAADRSTGKTQITVVPRPGADSQPTPVCLLAEFFYLRVP